MIAMKSRKADWIIFIAALVIFAGSMLLMRYLGHDGEEAVVYVNGEEVASYPLSRDIRETIQGYDGGENVLVIEDHRAKIESADCPDQSCMHQKAISANGETIVCLPHRIVVLIRSKTESEVDAVAQ